MAPRTRSGKGSSKDEIQTSQKALRVGPVNTTGFPALPVELLLEIASYFPSVEIPKFSGSVYDAEYLDRVKVLRALSQMCRSLRSTFLPYVWQRIEACASARKIRWNKDLATELVRQLEIVTIRDPTLAQYVKIVNIIITNYSADNVMAELVRCLALFPNLHTIQILGCEGPEPDIRNAFFGKQFPSVRTVVIPAHAHHVLLACPNARHVIYGSERNQHYLLSILSTNCRHLEILRGFSRINYKSFMQGKFFDELLETFPKMHTFVLDTDNITLTTDVVAQLAMFPQLVNIEINISTERGVPLPDRIQDIIQIAKNVLHKGPDVGGAKKHVNLVFPDSIKHIKVVG